MSQLLRGIIGLIAVSVVQVVGIIVAWDIGGIWLAIGCCVLCNIAIAVDLRRNWEREE